MIRNNKMTKKTIKVGSHVKHCKHGIGYVEVIEPRLNQCNVSLTNGPYIVCQLSDLKLVSTARSRKLHSTVNKLMCV